MSKAPLHEELGIRYMQDWFRGALFLIENTVHEFGHIEGSSILTQALNLDAKNPRFVSSVVPLEVLKDFTTLRFPKLGYRNYRQGKIDTLVANVTSVRSATRGLKSDILNFEVLAPFMVGMGHEFLNEIDWSRRVKEIYRPTFIPYTAGIRRLLEGEILGFAINEDLAVVNGCMQGSDAATVLFREKVVGSVTSNGDLSLSNKVLQRDSVRRKLFS